jgi:hypothetical protein
MRRVEVDMKLANISYTTPVVRFDQDARVVVVQYRDSDTGHVAKQIPSEEQLKRQRNGVAEAETSSEPTPVAPETPQAVTSVKASEATAPAAQDHPPVPHVSLEV